MCIRDSLYALGLPVSTMLSGRIAKAAFDPTYLAQHPPIYTTDPGPDATTGRSLESFSSEDALRVEERLAALGYLS